MTPTLPCTDVIVQYKAVLKKFKNAAASILPNAHLMNKDDEELGRQLCAFLEEAWRVRHGNFKKYSVQVKRHSDYINNRLMVRLREAKAQHTESKTNNNVEGRSLELSMIFKQVEENVYALREMEEEVAHTLTLCATTDSHIAILEAVCLEISRSGVAREGIRYCKERITHLEACQNPTDAIPANGGVAFGLEGMRMSLQTLERTTCSQDTIWKSKLGARWKDTWSKVKAFREQGATDEELQVLWLFTMRSKSLPPDLMALRSWVEGVMAMAEERQAEIEKEKSEKAVKDAMEDARFKKQYSHYSKTMLDAVKRLALHPSRKVTTKGTHEAFLEGMYGRLDLKDDILEWKKARDLAGRQAAKPAPGKMQAVVNAMVRGSTKDQLGGNTPTQILNADIFLEQYYRLFGKDEDQILVDHYGHRESKVEWATELNDADVLVAHMLGLCVYDDEESESGAGEE